MWKNFVFVDYENIQPKDLGLLNNNSSKTMVFLGCRQAKIPDVLAASPNSPGDDAEYVVLESAGRNALDFYIACYLGMYSHKYPSAQFHIISKDTGFDPLINHLNKKNIQVLRSTCISDIPCFAPVPDEQIEAVVTDLVRRNEAKPKSLSALLNTLRCLFKNQLSEQQLAHLFNGLSRRGLVKVDGTKVSYDSLLGS